MPCPTHRQSEQLPVIPSEAEESRASRGARLRTARFFDSGFASAQNDGWWRSEGRVGNALEAGRSDDDGFGHFS
jgi:hypothetical protein